MTSVQLASTEELFNELATRFESLLMMGKQAPVNDGGKVPQEEQEHPYYRLIKGDSAELVLICETAKAMVMADFLESGREPEAWER